MIKLNHLLGKITWKPEKIFRDFLGPKNSLEFLRKPLGVNDSILVNKIKQINEIVKL